MLLIEATVAPLFCKVARLPDAPVLFMKMELLVVLSAWADVGANSTYPVPAVAQTPVVLLEQRVPVSAGSVSVYEDDPGFAVVKETLPLCPE